MTTISAGAGRTTGDVPVPSGDLGVRFMLESGRAAAERSSEAVAAGSVVPTIPSSSAPAAEATVPAAEAEQAATRGKLAGGGRLGALRYRDFRLIFFSQGVSAIGSWMQLVTQGWLVYELTGSSLYLGLVALARAVPALVFSLVGGAVADRYDRRLIIAVANGVIGLLALVLGLLTLWGLIQVWQIIVIAFLMGTAFSFEMPSRQSMVSDVVGPKDVVNAVGLNSVAFNTAGVVGPALAAILIERIGAESVFLLNAASYVAVVAAAILVRPRRRAGRGSGGLLANVAAGLGYVRRTPELLGLILLGAAVSLLARPYTQLLPVFARDVLGVGASGLGALNAAAGGGALVAAIATATFGSYRNRGAALALCAALFGAALVLFSLSTVYPLSIGIAAALGFLGAFTGINSNSMLQTHSDPRLRGRMMSLHGLTMMGVVPLGTMLQGTLGSVIGVPQVVLLGGAGTLLAAAATLLLVPRLRGLD